MSDVRVTEEDTEYRESRSERPGHFSIEDEGRGQRITWYYRARNEQRTFTIRYTLKGAVKRYPDVADVYVQFVGDQWDRSIGEVRATLRLPDEVDGGSVRAWAHGPLHGVINGVGSQLLTLYVSPLPAHTFWEGRVVIPSEAFPGLPVLGNAPHLAACWMKRPPGPRRRIDVASAISNAPKSVPQRLQGRQSSAPCC